MGKTIESDNEYDPSSDIDNQCDSDDDYDDDLKNEDNTEVRAMVPGTRTKKQKTAQMAAANQLPPCSPTKFTRKQAARPTRAPQKEVRKKTIGLGLEKMIKRGNKLPIQVAKGKKRPDVPLQAAKLASETGVALRDKLPIYTSWKLYEKDGGPVEVQKVLDKVANRLDVDVKNDGPSKSACTDIIKKGVKQQRYHLKRKYFDESLTMEQLLAKEPPPKMKTEEWIELVKYWCDPKNQEKSAKNKVNRSKVQLHQKTGSRSYIAYRYSLRPKYNNSDPDAVEFFGECMKSSKNGRTPLANEIYERMVAEKDREPEEGEEKKSPTKIVDETLSEISRSSTFLPNIGAPRPSKNAQSSSTAAQARIRAEFEATLQAEREEAARKREELQAQLQAQQDALEENQNLLRQTQEEVRGMTSRFEETNALLRAVLRLQKD
ncbi:muscle M-line assembly protein unc-89-like [Panicum hallii]|uniref:muscle M-line assembly protein unc-89-like n=1 Tax=Panicum hallii TaxID=206008 RepID=UPI000DF4EC01|nr:muscle M-line assembly protein unc-89-like [Panicum hallii]